MSDFDQAIRTVLRNEGGYVNNPKDPGGETNFGISARYYPTENIKELTEERAILIYKRDFWDRYGYQKIQDQKLATKILDTSISCGPYHAHQLVQRALWPILDYLSVLDDAILGAHTIMALNQNPKSVLPIYKSEIANFFRAAVVLNDNLKEFLDGRLRRAYS